MVERRWLQRLGPPGAAALALALVAGSSAGAGDPAWQPPACAAADTTAAATAGLSGSVAESTAQAWFTIDPQLDRAGRLSGQRLRLGAGRDRSRPLVLPAEATAAGPFGRLILIAEDDGTRSTIGAIDASARCRIVLGTSSDVIRRATFDAAGTTVYEVRVDRSTRADLGVWRRPLDGSEPQRLAGPAPVDALVGPTFATTLGWSEQGDELVVQQCGAVLCRVRLVDIATGDVTAVPGRNGELIGVGDGRAVSYDVCPDLPCPVGATDMGTGRRTAVAPSAALARLIATPEGPRVAVQAAAGRRDIEVRRLDGSLEATVAVDPGLTLVPAPERAFAGAVVPEGWLLVAPDGRSPDGATLTRLADGTTVEIAEATR